MVKKTCEKHGMIYIPWWDGKDFGEARSYSRLWGCPIRKYREEIKYSFEYGLGGLTYINDIHL